ncbi:MAG: hypothetical protein IPN26_03590 [Bacteroidetes bacterium]|nr:hypothetical protein [Bacteroidota bacterium]
MSYINQPNIKGLGCDFKPQGFKQTYNHNLKAPPNMANYGLGKDTTKIYWPLCQGERSAECGVGSISNPSSIVFIVQNKHGKEGLV